MKKLLFSAIIVIIFCTSVASYYLESGKNKLDKSIEYFLSNVLSLNYNILAVEYTNLGPDLTGYWWISIDKKWDTKSMSKMWMTNGDDTIFYKDFFYKKFTPSTRLEGYTLYSNELPLSEGTICDTSNCNIDLLISADGANLFVSISKN